MAVLLLGAADATAAAGPGTATARLRADQVGSTHLLDVPYLAQTEDLCGGAAVAMVLRYWGERRIYPEDFATLVDRSAAGIRTDVLAAEIGRRGWRAFPIHASATLGGEWLREQVELARPIVALIEVRPNRYHYVVIVAWTGEQVIVHDPARAPFRVMSRNEFDSAWARAGRWALLVLPAEGPRPEVTPPTPSQARESPTPTDACGALVSHMVELALAGDIGGAETGLLLATRICPRHAAAWRELAGVRFLQSRWAEASGFAERALLLDSSDELGWDLLATARFLSDESDAALDAWNQIGRPAVDLVRVEGAGRTRQPVVEALVGLPPRSVLTSETYNQAARRLQELPSAAVTRLRYRPVDGGLAEIEALVVERSVVPRGVAAVAAGVRAGLQREVRLDLAGPTGSGELWTVAWRWWEARPRLAFALAVPGVLGLPGVTTIEGSWERPSYVGRPGTDDTRRHDRRRAAVTVADWFTSNVRWEAAAALDRWAQANHFSVGTALDVRLAVDRVSIGFDSALWVPTGSNARFAAGGVSAAWRSTREGTAPTWLATIGLAATTASAPLDLWPGAGAGDARTPLLRAHPLLHAGVLDGPVFGRRLAHGTAEYQHPLLAVPTGAIRLAAFIDSARAWMRTGGDVRPSWHADVGVGVRIALPGSGGTTRVDAARGLRDGRVVLSAGWQSPWPGR
jgi:predicted double-glycine peptidase